MVDFSSEKYSGSFYHELAFVNRSMRIPKIKKDPKISDISKLKSFDSVAFLEELKSKILMQ